MISIIIINYNVPERTDSLVEYIKDKVKIPYKLHVIDNGSRSEFVSKYTTLRIKSNRQKTGGLLTGLHMASKDNPDYYWIISTNMQFIPTDQDPAYELSKALEENEKAVGILPYWIGELPDWTHRRFSKQDNSVVHEVSTIGMYSMFDAKWLDSIGWFDPAFTFGWGSDFELKYIAKNLGKVFLCHDTVGYDITKGAVFKLNRDKPSLDDFQALCREEMERVMRRKYGVAWRDVLDAYE